MKSKVIPKLTITQTTSFTQQWHRKLYVLCLYGWNIDKLWLKGGIKSLISYSMMYHQAYIHKISHFNKIYLHSDHILQIKIICIIGHNVGVSTWKWVFKHYFNANIKSPSYNLTFHSHTIQLVWQHPIYLWNSKLKIFCFTVFMVCQWLKVFSIVEIK